MSIPCAVARRSAETGGTEPARLTQTTLVGLETVPDEVSVIEPAVDLRMVVRDVERIARRLGGERRRQRGEGIGPARAVVADRRHPNRRNRLPFTVSQVDHDAVGVGLAHRAVGIDEHARQHRATWRSTQR